MARLKLYVFGTPRLEHDSQPIELNLRKALALLVYLAATGQPHSRDALATLLWPESDQSEGRARLRRTLHRLNQALGQAILDVGGDSIRLQPDADLWIDSAVFRHHVTAGLPAAPDAALAPGRVAHLVDAVALYADDFLSGFTLPDSPAFDEWQFFQRESLRQLYGQVLEQLVAAYRSQCAWDQAIPYARRWVALDPLHEPAQRTLMRLYAWAGQLAAASRQYQECARILADELGAEPEQETTALYEAIRARQLAPPLATAPTAETAGKLQLRQRYAAEGPPTAVGGQGAVYHEHDPYAEVRRFVESEPATRRWLPAAKAEPATAMPPAPGGRHHVSEPRAAELPPPHNLPAQATSFVGRKRELEDLARRLRDPGCRLLTLCGPGGMGKTRLALAAAESQLSGDSPFADGVFFVELAPLSAATEIALAIANATGFAFYTEQPPLQQLCDFLSQKRALIVLDNFEHLLGGESARLSMALLAAAPGVKLLVTSRACLNVQGEHAIFVEGMPAPDSEPVAEDGAETADEAVRLFVERARRVRPDFALSSANQASVLKICQLVQRMPLGIELAAAWLGVLSPAEIAAEIERSIDFLEAEWHDAPERHQSLRAVFDASWQMLADQERAALGALTVFQGTFTRDAAAAVADVSPKMLRALTNASWLQRDEDGRLKIHELLRQYAGEKIQADQAAWERCRQRHGAYFAEWLAQHEQYLKGPRPEEACAAVMKEVDNLRAAWHWLVAQGQAEAAIRQMLPAMFHACEAQFRAFALLPLLEAAQTALAAGERADDRLQLAILLTVQGAFLRTGTPLRTQGLDIGPAYEEAIRRAWTIAGTPDQLRAIDVWGVLLAAVYGWAIDANEGIRQLRQLIPHLRAQRQAWTLGFALQLLGRLLYLRLPDEAPDEPLAEADRHLTEALAIFQSCGDERESGNSLRLRGAARLLQRRLRDASADLQAAQARLEGIGDWANAANVSWQLADVHFLLGDTQSAFAALRRMSEAYAERGHQVIAINALSRESYEAVRYSTIEHARATRERCVALARQTGDAIAEAWSSWEMGELERVAGDATAARQWYEQARVLFERIQEPSGPLFYQRGLADLAHAAGDFAEARQRFADSAAQARDSAHYWAAAYALAGLARAALAQGEAAPAQSALVEALAKARKNVDAGIVMVVLSGAAGLYAALGHYERAVELAALVAEHHAAWRETKAQAAAVLESAAAMLTAERSTLAQARGRTSDIWETVDQLARELPQVD